MSCLMSVITGQKTVNFRRQLDDFTSMKTADNHSYSFQQQFWSLTVHNLNNLKPEKNNIRAT